MHKPKLLKSIGEPDCGDMLFAHDYFHDELCKPYTNNLKKEYRDLQYFYLDSQNKWKSLCNYIDDVPDYTKFMYKCPYIDMNRYYWLIPIAILSDDIKKYEELCEAFDWQKDMMFDFEWTRKHSDIKEYLEYESSITISLMGHGYTDDTLPSDGDGYRKLITLKLDNGDYVVAISHIWYNK